jgi:tripartite-type tricarboxylate transporter receptor subunit TctC
MRTLVLGVALIAILAPARTGTAQDFPSHPITMIVPFAAGGPNDTIGRIVTERITGPRSRSGGR